MEARWRAIGNVVRRGGWSRATLAGFVAWSSFVAAPSASGHTLGVAVPPESDYMIRWYQPHGARPIDDWEIEVTPTRNPWARFIATARVVPDASCWALQVPVAEPSVVRVRSVVGTQVSSWTRPTSVPEPGLAAGMLVGVGAIAGLVRRRARGAALRREQR
jgi:hypothetical protein